VKLGPRTVLAMPEETLEGQELREWGYADEAVSMPGWARPSVKCDPAFANIRAGMGGVKIAYRFAVKPKSRTPVVLGFCESHWAQPGQRPLLCRVEGAESQTVDPVARWGQHKPGALAFAARDVNGDGKLEVTVSPAPGANDRNSILNAIWLFPPGPPPKLDQVIAGALSAKAIRYVAVGGDKDQSIYPAGKLEYKLNLPAGGVRELAFFVACQGGSAPIPGVSAWTTDGLRRAAADVWRQWTAGAKP
jgi:hypothetical protein